MGKLAGLARMTTATTGTSTVTLLAAVADRLTFALAGISNGDWVSYGIVDLGNGNVEMGEGAYGSAGPTLTRERIWFSTNGGSAISISASGAEVYITPLPKDIHKLHPHFKSPLDSEFAWINQGGAAVTVNANGGIYLTAPGNSGQSLRIRKKAAPSTPYTITACFLMNLIATDNQTAGLCWRQSSDGKVITLQLVSGDTHTDYNIQSADNSSPTLFSASNAVAPTYPGSPLWLRMADNGTNRIQSWSLDGYNFTQLLSEGRTTFLTADEVGFFANTNFTTWPASCTLLSWEQT